MPEITNVPNDTPVVAVPATINADFSMPLDELRQAAFPTAEPTTPAAAPVVTTPPAAPATESQDYQIKTTAEGIEIHLATGEVFKGKDINDALPKVLNSKVQSERYIKTLKREPVAAAPVAPAAPVMTEEQVDQQYWAIATTQGKAAADRFYAQQRPAAVLDMVAASLGMQNGQELQSLLGNMRQTSDVMSNSLAASNFISANPDFPATPEASDALVNVAAELYQAMTGLEPTEAACKNPALLRQAHREAIARGLYKPATAAPAPTPGVQPPPMVQPTGNSGAPVMSEKDLWSKPIDELRKQAFGR